MSNTNELMKVDLPEVNSILVNFLEGKHNLTTPEQVDKVESKMLKFPQAECSVKHYVGAGVYIREVTIPAGVFSVGHYQNFDHMNHIVKGRVIMLDDDGSTREAAAGETFVCASGRKIGFIVEEMVWRNIYPNPDNETDFDVLEEKFVTKSEGWGEDREIKNNLEYLSRHTDREDYKKMLIDVGVKHEVVVEQSEYEGDQIPFPRGFDGIKVAKSNIQGKGLFLLSPIKEGEVIAPARINSKRTPAGRYTNHAMNPNAKLALKENGDIDLIAIKDIRGCHGGDSGEEVTVDYRKSVSLSRGEL